MNTLAQPTEMPPLPTRSGWVCEDCFYPFRTLGKPRFLKCPRCHGRKVHTGVAWVNGYVYVDGVVWIATEITQARRDAKACRESRPGEGSCDCVCCQIDGLFKMSRVRRIGR